VFVPSSASTLAPVPGPCAKVASTEYCGATPGVSDGIDRSDYPTQSTLTLREFRRERREMKNVTLTLGVLSTLVVALPLRSEVSLTPEDKDE
jgi:hypothetical protein